MPRELPESPAGYTRRMVCHLNFGGGHGAATYEVFGPAGEKMPFGWGYDSGKQKKDGKWTRENEEGFLLPGLEAYLTWGELRQMWPAYLERELLKSLDEG